MPDTHFRIIRTLLASTIILVVLGVIVSGCSMTPAVQPEEKMAYFEDPQQAVDSIRTMLSANAWAELSRYYDLTGTDIKRKSLISGDFFVREKRPEVSHPAGFWRYKQPFSPQFSYLAQHPLADDIVEVTVHIEIDEGGGMVQRGMDSFQLRKSTNGYQLLPKKIQVPPSASEIPVSMSSSSEMLPDLKK